MMGEVYELAAYDVAVQSTFRRIKGCVQFREYPSNRGWYIEIAGNVRLVDLADMLVVWVQAEGVARAASINSDVCAENEGRCLMATFPPKECIPEEQASRIADAIREPGIYLVSRTNAVCRLTDLAAS